jgi:hypothetical protein
MYNMEYIQYILDCLLYRALYGKNSLTKNYIGEERKLRQEISSDNKHIKAERDGQRKTRV